MKPSPAALAITLLLCTSAWGNVADPPERVAAVTCVDGDVSLRTEGAPHSDQAVLNWPVARGDRVDTGAHARAELSLGIAALHLDERTHLIVQELERGTSEVRLTSGTLNVQLRTQAGVEAFKVQIPNSEIWLLEPGSYRITAADSGTSSIAVKTGKARVNTGLATYEQQAGESAQIANDRTVTIGSALASTAFDEWALARQRGFTGAQATQHVAPGVAGYEALDAYGRWHWERDYGMVWEPARVAESWAPYRFGRWLWKAPWGWTWVDDAPWGFAPSHYGRWVHLRDRWEWLPGPRQIPAVYAPALVAWEPPSNEPNVIAWYPLGPGEPFVPSYAASERYLHSVNIFASVGAPDRPPTAPKAERREVAAVTWGARSNFGEHAPPTSTTAKRVASEPPRQPREF